MPMRTRTATMAAAAAANKDDDSDNCHSATTFRHHHHHLPSHSDMSTYAHFRVWLLLVFATTTHHPPTRAYVYTHFRGWLLFATTTTFYLPPSTTLQCKCTCTLVLEGGCCLPPPPPPPSNASIHVRSFSRVLNYIIK